MVNICVFLGGADDYSLLIEHEGMGICVLGYQSVYNLTKEESM